MAKYNHVGGKWANTAYYQWFTPTGSEPGEPLHVEGPDVGYIALLGVKRMGAVTAAPSGHGVQLLPLLGVA